MASLVLLFCLLTVTTADAERPQSSPYGPIHGDGPGLENPVGGFGGGDGGDPDEYLLVDYPGHTPQIISDNAANPAGKRAVSWDFLRVRIWWIGFLFDTGIAP